MPIDDLTNRVEGLVQDYHSTRDVKMIFDAEADADAEALWKVLRGVDLDTAPTWLKSAYFTANAVLGRLHHLRYQAAGEDRAPAELARALLCLEEAADDASVVPEDLRPVVGRFTDLKAQAAMARTMIGASAAQTDPAVLDAGILLLTPVTRAARGRERAGPLIYLSYAHRLRHERDGSAADLRHAIEAGEEAVTIAAAHGQDLGGKLAHLGFAYRCRHRLQGDPEDLARVIDLLERALAAGGPRASLLAELGRAYRQRYETTGESADIERAVTLAERAVAGGPEDPAVLAGLGDALLRRYERSGDRADLWRAADLAERVVAALPGDDPRRGVHLATAASVLLRRHERSREPADVRRATDLYEQAVAVLPDDDPDRPGVLRGLAAALHQRYLTTGADTDLDRAATLGAWALAGIPAGHPGRDRASMELAAVHLTRHSRTGVLADLDHAIGLAERVVADAEPCPPDWSATLGAALQQRHSVTGVSCDLDRAIELGEAALAATRADDFALAGRRARLAAGYRRRHEQHGERGDLDRAIDLGERAVAATPDDHVALPEWLAGLAAARLARHRLDRTPDDLSTAIEMGERTLASVPADHPLRCRLATDLCTAYLERVVGGGTAPGPERLGELARTVTEARVATPVDRVAAHHAVGALAHAAGHPRIAVTMLDTATTLLPSVAPREAAWADQQHRLGAHFGLVESAVAAHCALGDPAGAVEVAELGRGVLLASQANTRVDLAELRSRDPRLADRFRWVCERLNTPDFPADERRRWWADYDALLTDVRALPGMADFLALPRLADLRSVAAGGHVVLVNAGRSGGEAVVVRAGADPVLIDLPDLRLADVETRVATLPTDVAATPLVAAMRRARAVRAVLDVLSWSWDSVVAPIVEELHRHGTAPHRVWWLPTGLLGLLPLHAAGHAGEPGALDVLVSSSIPSLRALREARDRPPARHRRSLTVALHHTPGLPDLPGAAIEATVPGGTALIDAQATTFRVLAALEQVTWAHFACHAVVDPASQADSGLRLQDRTLRLPEIGGLHLPDAELAYLSACSTADHGTRYADEVLHLASAFQLAGFRHVVASLWPLSDETAVSAARSFYQALPDTPVADGAAAVLREVVLRLREEYPERPDLWASLVHSGP